LFGVDVLKNHAYKLGYFGGFCAHSVGFWNYSFGNFTQEREQIRTQGHDACIVALAAAKQIVAAYEKTTADDGYVFDEFSSVHLSCF
jgi:hypothetical protein